MNCTKVIGYFLEVPILLVKIDLYRYNYDLECQCLATLRNAFCGGLANILKVLKILNVEKF